MEIRITDKNVWFKSYFKVQRPVQAAHHNCRLVQKYVVKALFIYVYSKPQPGDSSGSSFVVRFGRGIVKHCSQSVDWTIDKAKMRSKNMKH